MQRGSTGYYVTSIAGGVNCLAFVPTGLPLEPPIQLDIKLQGRIFD